MATPILPGSLASATLADLRLSELYVGPVTWIGDREDGDAIKVVFERVDGGFDTFMLGDLRACVWWRLGRADDVVALEALMTAANGAAVDTCDAGQRERRRVAIAADQAAARARLVAA